MPSRARQLTEFLSDLQQIEKAALSAHGPLILDAFIRHAAFDTGAVYLRESRGAILRLAARSDHCLAPETLDSDDDGGELPIEPRPHAVIPIRSSRDAFGFVALSGRAPSENELEILRAAGSYLGMILTNVRLVQEMREGDLQLRYRLLELESLYDIGLSIAATLNIDELADAVLVRMISLINARRAALFLREGSRFRIFRAFGEVRNEFLDEELSGRIVAAGEAMTFEHGAECIFPQCASFVAVPIKGNNATIGVLAAADRENRQGGIGAFDANELRLLSLFANQVAIALENARLHRGALEKQAMDRDLELAATIQRNILPKTLPRIDGIDVAILSRPARQVGGDYHAFFERDGTLTMVVADVAGKSMPAALLVSAFHAAVQLLFADGRELGDIATELDRHLHRWSAENKFVTMILVAIDPVAETLEFVNAGHNPCYILTDGRMDLLKSHGLPIGILGNSQYRIQMRSFPAGSAVVLYSDGITEAENIGGEEFENERLEAVLTEIPSASSEDLRNRIASAVEAFVGEAAQKDDQTLVIARTRR